MLMFCFKMLQEVGIEFCIQILTILPTRTVERRVNNNGNVIELSQSKYSVRIFYIDAQMAKMFTFLSS